jgi:hypothetical protein
MTNQELPWTKMAESSKRKIDVIPKHNIYWITDINGRYGIYIASAKRFISEKLTISLNGIEVIKRNSQSGVGELILLLNKKEDSQIFCKLCEDLISTVELHHDNDGMVSAVEVRLQRWQELLKKSSNYVMSIEAQMGLFAELTLLEKVLFQKIGVEQAINAWVGPDFDKQDFLLDNAVIEVKSYRTSKGQQVSISSAQQLYCEKQPLFLVSYGLTRSENGKNVNNISSDIKVTLSKTSKLLLDIFNIKLIDYGFIPELENEPYIGFLIDTTRVFQVNANFPKLIPPMIPLEIPRVKYSIDLSLCNDFEVEFTSIFEKA